MIVHLDTSLLIEAFATSNQDRLRHAGLRDDKLAVSTLVIYEWLRRPRSDGQREMFNALFPGDRIVVFGSDEARTAARLYRDLSRPRAREVDIAIAACAVERQAALWTLNPKDFRDIPGLTLYGG